MNLRRILEHAIQITSALSNLHRTGSLHLDIRPAHIEADPETGAVTLKGLTSTTGADAGLSDEPKINAPSLPYIAPERTGRLDRPVDHRADLYSLGVTLYELLAGKMPFDAEDAPGWVHCHVARAPTPLYEAAPDVPRVVADIVMKLLAKAPEDRYQTAVGLEADLRQCVERLAAHGAMEPFPLGNSDIPDRLQLPSKLYGRDTERTTLLEAFERVVATGVAELVLVTGYSGIGKTSLVREVQAPIVRERGAFISGKFEQLQRDIPYRTIAQAFGELVRQMLSESTESLAGWKRRLEAALGHNGRLITDIVPQLALIIGEQPPVPPLPSSEAQNRFYQVFQAFLGAVARKKHPLVLFVDDLQWADPASLRLLRRAIASPEARHLLVIGAYRDNEVSPSHPLVEVVQQIREAGAHISTIHLGPLQPEYLNELVKDTFHCNAQYAEPLTRILAEKTGGNPFFVGQFLTELYRERLVWVDKVSCAWRWDIEAIEAQNLTDNVVDLVLMRLRRLGVEVQQVVTLAACLGSRVDAEVLSALHGKTPEETHADIAPAIREGLVARRSRAYKFLHDRVQQAAYLLIPAERRAEMHLRVGRLLLARTSEQALDERLFEITNQLDIGAALITDPEERRRVADLDLRAGRKARASGAYGSAVSYLTAGAALLGEDAWAIADGAVAFALNLELAECACLNGELERAEKLAEALHDRAKTSLDRAAVYRVRMQVHLVRSEHAQCIEVGLKCLAELGVELPSQPSSDDALVEIKRLREVLRDRSAEEILNQPRMTDPVSFAIMSAISVVYPSTFYVSPNLNDLLVCRMVDLSLSLGTTDSTGLGFTSLAKSLCVRLDAYAEGDRIGKLGCDLVDKWNSITYKPEVCNVYASAISIWNRHFSTYVDYSRLGVRAANESGNVTWGSFNHLQLLLALLERGDPLDEAYNASVAALDYAVKGKIFFVTDVMTCLQRLVQALRGMTDHVGTLNGEGFDEQAFEEHLAKAGYPGVRLVYQLVKLQSRFMGGDIEVAAAAALAAGNDAAGGTGMILSADYHYWASLALTAHLLSATADVQSEYRKAVDAHAEQLGKWAESCPDNFAGRHALVSAEIARIEDRHLDAAALYDKAIMAFRQSGFAHQEAIASELAARFYLDRGYTGLPGLYLREAVDAYARWGASAKVRQLEQRYALLLDQEQRRSAGRGVMKMAAEAVEAQAAMKVSRSLSSDMTPAEMMGTLMRLVVEHEGAERCCLILIGDGLRLVGEGIVGREGIDVRVFDQSTAPQATRVPISLLNYVQRTRERVLISDAKDLGAFVTDEYLARERPKSVLCLPLMKSPGEVGGLLYLENRLVHGAFILRRLSLLEFLAALSLQNTVLRDELAQGQAKLDRTEEALRRSEQALRDLIESPSSVR